MLLVRKLRVERREYDYFFFFRSSYGHDDLLLTVVMRAPLELKLLYSNHTVL